MMTSKCNVDGCLNTQIMARGMCRTHYKRWYKHGDLSRGRGTATQDRISWALSQETDECVIWPWGRNADGYARVASFKTNQLPSVMVSRVVCIMTRGEPPTPTHHAAHSCGRGHEGCVNKRHLVWKTPTENCADQLVHGTRCKGSQKPMAKMTEAKVISLRTRYAAGEKLKDLAKEFGISYPTAKGINQRQGWNWL